MPKEPGHKALVTLSWVDRTFEYDKITVPFPSVGITAEAVRAIAVASGITLERDEHVRLERLVEGRIFNVCGFTSFGADANDNVVPTRARPEALRVAEIARDLVAALDRFDVVNDGRGKNNLEHSISRAKGADPREVIQAVADLYSRFVPTAARENKLGRAVFMADLREQVLKPALSKHPSPPEQQLSEGLLRKFLAAVDVNVLRPLDRIGIEPPDGSLPIRRRKKSKALNAALIRGGSDTEDGIDKAIKRDLRAYDAECAAATEYWSRALGRARPTVGRTKLPG